MDIIRKDTARHYREIRKILRSDNNCEEQEMPQDSSWMFWLVIGCLCLMMLFGISCAHAQELTASWYSVESLKKEGTWKHSHGRMANGKIFKDEAFTCATRVYPLGTRLKVVSVATGKSVIVRVSDRIGRRFAKKRIDLSQGSFKTIASLNQGLIKVNVERV